MTEKSFPTSIRLNARDKEILKTLTEYYGISESDVIKVLLRDKERDLKERNIKMQDQYEVRVIRGNRAEFVAWKGDDEQLSKDQFNLWKNQENVEKVGRFVNGEWAQPPYIRTQTKL